MAAAGAFVTDAGQADQRGSAASGRSADTWLQEDANLLPEALAGDTAAWEQIVRLHAPQLRRIAGWYRIGDEAGDAVQNAFLLLFEHGRDIRDARALQAWLATTVRRECLRIIRRHGREVSAGVDFLDDVPSARLPAEHGLIQRERAELVRDAISALPARLQNLIGMLNDPATDSYREISVKLSMPVGSIGPTRQRTLTRLRRRLATQGLDSCA